MQFISRALKMTTIAVPTTNDVEEAEAEAEEEEAAEAREEAAQLARGRAAAWMRRRCRCRRSS